MKTKFETICRVLGAGVLACSPAFAWAEDAPVAGGKSAEELVEQLDLAEFSDRQEAGKRLAEMGKKALPALEKGAVHDSREVVARSLDLLKRLHDSTEQATKSEAAEALQRLAKSENGGLARRAKEILEPKIETPNIPPQNAFPIAPGAPRIIRVQAAIGGGRRVTVKNVGGVRDIEAEEEGRKVKIHDDPAKGIEVEITTKKDDKEETKKYEAKDAEELKKKHPEAHEYFEKYGKQGEIKLEFGGRIAVPGGVPALPAVPALPIDPADLRKRQIEVFDRSIESLERSIESMQEQKKKLQEKKAALEAEEAKR